MNKLNHHIAQIEREAALYQALLAQLRAERAFQAAGSDVTRRAAAAAALGLARRDAAREEEDNGH